ncbi:MAG: DNA-binding proteins Bright/BRCAA1/RBP1 and proteins containing BRIGHT domain [Icmadophila ericetorum]|nr:DNA-binding proteins Bright/BRCAA1/RBP1 and proteins containing BRIGHT domain [Icmadophila ericetorum]
MATNKTSNSSIAMALAGMTASVDIPKSNSGSFWNGKDTFAAVAARSLPDKNPRAVGLPTPPNSISPTLPPQGYKSHTTTTPPTPPPQVLVDSDFDLQDAVDHAKAQDQPQRGLALSPTTGNLANLDTAGAITPALLAKHFLPKILLDHGPLAIRHVMGYLTTSVPGFSGIPPAKARRLVVGALEGRGNGGEGGGLHGEVEFEKVGWGRWDAKRRGHQSRDGGIRRQSPLAARHPSPGRRGTSPYTHGGLRIPYRNGRQDRARNVSKSRSVNLSHQSHDMDIDDEGHLRDISMLENEADKMSLDGDESCSSSEAPDDSPIPEDDIGDVTDEEDWASIGAAALRQGSFPQKSGGGRIYGSYLSSGHSHSKDRSGGPSSSTLAKSMPMPKIYTALSQRPARPHRHHSHQQTQPRPVQRPQEPQQQPVNHLSDFMNLDGIGNDSQEREAIEALVRLSSV